MVGVVPIGLRAFRSSSSSLPYAVDFTAAMQERGSLRPLSHLPAHDARTLLHHLAMRCAHLVRQQSTTPLDPWVVCTPSGLGASVRHVATRLRGDDDAILAGSPCRGGIALSLGPSRG